MTSKNLSFNYLLRRNCLSRIWAVVLSLFGFLGSITLIFFVVYQGYLQEQKMLAKSILAEAEKSYQLERAFRNVQLQVQSLLSFENPMVKMVMIVLAILCGVAMFRYLHDRKQVDFYHALPLNRTQLFILNYVTGILTVIPIYLIVLFATNGIAGALGLAGKLTFSQVLQGIWGNIAYFLLIYTIAVLCTILTGNTIVTILLGLWAMFGISAYLGVYSLIQSNYYHTHEQASAFLSFAICFSSPILGYFSIDPTGLNSLFIRPEAQPMFYVTTILLVVTVIVVVLIALSFFLFCRRKSENSGMALAFIPFKTPLRWFMTILCGFLGMLFFEALFISESTVVEWIGIVLGVVVSHMVIEIIYDFDFKSCIHHWKQMILMVVLCGVVFIGLKNDVLGFNRYVPNPSDVQSVSIESRYTDNENGNMFDPLFAITDQKLIEDICQIATIYCENYGEYPNEKAEDMESYLRIQYTLKNGNKVSRYYDSVKADVVRDKWLELAVNPEFIKSTNALQHLALVDEGLDQYSVLTISNGFDDIIVYEIDQMKQIIDQLKQEQIENAQKHLSEIPVFSAGVEVQIEGNGVYGYREEDGNIYAISNLYIYPSDVKTIALIEQLTGLKIDSIAQRKIKGAQIIWEYSSNYAGKKVYTKESNVVDIIDQATIQQLVQDAHYHDLCDGAGRLNKIDYPQRTIGEKEEITLSDLILIDQSGKLISVCYPKGKMPLELIESLIGYQS